MKELINNKMTISSREVAKMMEVRHDNLMNKIEKHTKILQKVTDLKIKVSDLWEAFYRFVNYELDTNINKRKGSGLERFSEKELRKMLLISIKWARVNNIEVNNGLSNIQISSEELNNIKIF